MGQSHILEHVIKDGDEWSDEDTKNKLFFLTGNEFFLFLFLQVPFGVHLLRDACLSTSTKICVNDKVTVLETGS